MGNKNREQPPEKGSLKITKPEMDAEYSRLLRKAAATKSGERTAKVVYLILGEARKALGKELQEEVEKTGPEEGHTRRYLILYFVGEHLDNDLKQARSNIIPDGVSTLVGSTPSPDDERRKRKPTSGE